MKAIINDIVENGTKATVVFMQKTDEDGNNAVSNPIPLAYAVYSAKVQIFAPYTKGETVDVLKDEYGKRYINKSFQTRSIPALFAVNEAGFFFEGGDKISYNIDTKVIDIQSSLNINIKSDATIKLEAALIELN